MEADTTRALGEGQELLTIDKLFPTLEFFFTREGTSLVSQEAAACLELPSGNGGQALRSTCPGHLGLLRERRAVTLGTLSGLPHRRVCHKHSRRSPMSSP